MWFFSFACSHCGLARYEQVTRVARKASLINLLTSLLEFPCRIVLPTTRPPNPLHQPGEPLSGGMRMPAASTRSHWAVLVGRFCHPVVTHAVNDQTGGCGHCVPFLGLVGYDSYDMLRRILPAITILEPNHSSFDELQDRVSVGEWCPCVLHAGGGSCQRAL